MSEKRYMIVGDDSGHEYVIPVDMRGNWTLWLVSQDAKDGNAPDYAQRREGKLTFTDPELT